MTSNPQLSDEATLTPEDVADAQADAESQDNDYSALLFGALFFWDVSRGAWARRSTGQVVDVQGMYRYIDIIASIQRTRLDAIYRAFLTGRANEVQMLDAMTQVLRRTHLQSAALGRGGFERLTRADLRQLGNFLQDEFGYLTEWARLATTEGISEAEARRRLGMYANHVQSTYFEAHTQAKADAGYTEMRRSAVNDHVTCSDCSSYDAQGWQPIGTLPPPGVGCQCLSNCRCTVEYR